MVIEYGQDRRHSFQIIFIMQYQQIVQKFVAGCQIVFINLDQLAAVILILTAYAQKTLDTFLFQVFES